MVVRVAGNTSQGSTWTQPGQFQTPADSVVTALYRGILMRDPDDGAAGARSDISRHGYDGVRRVALNIANSPESRSLGENPAQRLEALYGHLLGWSRADVGRDRWESDLSQINDGNVAGVVDAIVRSEQFRSRFAI